LNASSSQDAAAGSLKLLYISPERLLSQPFAAVAARLPRIALAVIDEAHCASE
jgi:ATP-dependent DNA helicase RecQ